MRLTEKKIDAINETLASKYNFAFPNNPILVEAYSACRGASVVYNDKVICSFEELEELCRQLSFLSKAVEEETGIVL